MSFYREALSGQHFRSSNGLSESSKPEKKILVVEDDPYTASMTREVLELITGISTDVCATGSEAQERLDTDSGIGVIVSDLQIGEESGLDVAKAARDKGVEVIIFTASDSVPSGSVRMTKPEEYRQTGIRCWMGKPFDSGLLAGVVMEGMKQSNVGPIHS